MNRLSRGKSTHQLLSGIDVLPPLNLHRASFNQDNLKNGRLNYTLADNHQGAEQQEWKKRAASKFRGNQQEFKRQKSLYRQMVSRNTSMKLLKEESSNIYELHVKYIQSKPNQQYQQNSGNSQTQNMYSECSENGNLQNRERRFRRKNVQKTMIQNDYTTNKKQKRNVIEVAVEDNNCKETIMSTNCMKEVDYREDHEDLQTKQSQHSLREQISMQQRIIHQQSMDISKLESNIHELRAKVNKLNEIISEKETQNKAITSQADYLKHHFSKIINDFNPIKAKDNQQGQDYHIQNQIRQIEDQILSLKNSIKYLEIQNLTLKKVKSEVDLQKQTIVKLQNNKQHLEKNIALLKVINGQKSKKIQQFMSQNKIKRFKTQIVLQSLFSDNSDNSLDLSFQDQKILKTSKKQQISAQNQNFIKLLNSNSKKITTKK